MRSGPGAEMEQSRTEAAKVEPSQARVVPVDAASPARPSTVPETEPERPPVRGGDGAAARTIPDLAGFDEPEEKEGESDGTSRGDGKDGDHDDDAAKNWGIRARELRDEAQDPLLGCLVILTGMFERPFSPAALTAGLPLVDGRLTPDLFLRAGERAGLSCRIVKRRLEGISKLVLPAVLLLDDLSACVLAKRIDARTVEVIVPESGIGTQRIAIDELAESYSGYAIFVRPEYQFDGRIDDISAPTYKSWFWGTLVRFWPTYGQVILASILINLFALTSPLFIMNVYDRVVPNNAVETLWVLAAGAATVYGFDFLLRSMRGYFVDGAGKSADVVLASRIFHQVLNIQMQARPASAGAFASNLRDFETVRDFFTSATVSTLVDLPFVVFFIFVIWLVAGPVAYIPAGAAVLVILVGAFIQVPLNHTVQRTHSDAAQRHGILVEAIGGLETVKSLGAEGRMQRQWERFVALTADSSRRSRLLSTGAVNFSMFAAQVVTVGIVVVGVYLIKDGSMTIGGLIAAVILGGRAMAPLAQFANLLVRYHQSKVALATLNEIMSMPVERPSGKAFVSRPITEGAVELKNVIFSYPNQKIPALNGVSFQIKPGERVGIIGRIGSGKSTIGKLLVGLYQPKEGSVLADGVDLRQIDPADLRRGIGYVPQDVFLFYGTVRDNIAMGAPYADDRMIVRAAKISGADDFISRHPAGYDLPVGERGESLSGGQRQTIAVARALMLDPQILILDEPTSGMDHSSEQALKRRLMDILPGKTLVLISHRASLLPLVDRVIVLDSGKVVADGPRDAVLRRLREGKLRVARA